MRICFEHSPGRTDRNFLGNKSAFDVAFKLEPSGGPLGDMGVETKCRTCATGRARATERARTTCARASPTNPKPCGA